MNYRLLILSIAATLVFAGCGDSKASYKPQTPPAIAPASVAAGQEATLFPVDLGNRWVYDMTSQTKTVSGNIPQMAEYSLEIKKVEDSGGGKVVTIAITKGDVLQDEQIWKVDSTGIYQMGSGAGDSPRVVMDPPQPVMKFPLDGTEATWTGKIPVADGKKQDATMVVVCKGPEEVDSLMGTLSAYHVESTQTFTDDKNTKIETKTVSWWAPKVGLVRHVLDTKANGIVVQHQMLVLKQKTLKQ